MPALSNATLFAKLRAALPPGTKFDTAPGVIHPAIGTVPGIGRVRVYLFTVTPDRSAPGARPPGEFKIQLIIDGQVRGEAGSLYIQDAYTLLLGYSPDFGVFCSWEARLYKFFGYSANVQVRENLLIEARNTGWAIAAPRAVKGTSEVRVAFSAGNLLHYIRMSRSADAKLLEGQWREAFFLAHSPNYKPLAAPPAGKAIVKYVEKERQRLLSARLSRDRKFAPRVKEQFDYSCAVCLVQLEIVEAAHIIPVNDPKSSDDIWNGIALCPSHHTLFDARRFVVCRELGIRVDFTAVEFLKESGRASGIELLLEHDGSEIMRPFFWSSQASLRERMQGALEYTSSLQPV